MPRYKVGEVVVVGAVEVIIVRGKCENCSFDNHKTEESCIRAESCIDEIGIGNCFKVLKEGL